MTVSFRSSLLFNQMTAFASPLYTMVSNPYLIYLTWIWMILKHSYTLIPMELKPLFIVEAKDVYESCKLTSNIYGNKALMTSCLLHMTTSMTTTWIFMIPMPYQYLLQNQSLQPIFPFINLPRISDGVSNATNLTTLSWSVISSRITGEGLLWLPHIPMHVMKSSTPSMSQWH